MMKEERGYKVIEFHCTECGKPYYVRPCDVKKRKTRLCRTCMLTQRNQSAPMREAVREANLGKIVSEETRQKLRRARQKYWTGERREAHSAEGNPSWHGGMAMSSGGYIYMRAPGHPRATQKGHYVFEHILIMEDYLGRLLKPHEVVHHINGDTTDNRIENLQLMTASEHAGFHSAERWAEKRNGG